MDKLKPYLPFAVRLFATIAAGVAVLVAAKWKADPTTLEATATAVVLAWTRWHPSASLKAVFAYLGIKDESPELPIDTPPSGSGS